MASSSVPATPHVGLLFGPMLIGVFLNVMLYGILIVQMFLYYHRYKSDRPWFRYFALYLLVAETANVVCDIGLIYEPLIVRYGTLEALLVSPLLLRADAILTVAISTPIQIFIAWRVRIMTGSLILPAMISIFAIVSFCGGTATTVVVSLHPDYASFPHFHGEVVTWLASSAACDIFLTSSLVYSLYTRKTNFAGTDSYLNRAIRLTVQTGLITAAAALLDLLVYLLVPNTTLNFVWDFALSKLYTNALISTLNARRWREPNATYLAPNVLFEQSPVNSSLGSAHTPAAYHPRETLARSYIDVELQPRQVQHGANAADTIIPVDGGYDTKATLE